MSKLVHGVEFGIGGIIGFTSNRFALKLSDLLTNIVKSITRNIKQIEITTGQYTWIGWLLAVAIFASVASGGGYFMFSAFGSQATETFNWKPHAGSILAGFGAGGLLEELFNVPDVEELMA